MNVPVQFIHNNKEQLDCSSGQMYRLSLERKLMLQTAVVRHSPSNNLPST